MAIGNEDKTPHYPQSRTKPKAKPKAKEGILPNDTINAFVVTSISCTTHNDTTVSLFCQTCDDLVCFKCVSSSPDIKHSPHRDHKHTHLVHAYDIQKENLQNKIVKLQETLSAQSNLRQKLLQRLQIFKFEVLRKKTQLSRCARSLKSKVVVNERACQRQLEMLVQPAIERIDGIFQEVDYDVVSGSGLMGAAESLQQMSVRDRLPFLKNVCRVMREVDALLCKHYSIRDSDTMDNPPELLSLGSVSIDRDRETRVLHKVLLLATCVPSKPRLLFSWCTVGAHSASIVWKYNKSDVVDKFVIKHHPTTETLDKEVDGDGPNGECGLVDGDRARVGSGCVTVNKFMSGRVQATLLRLKPDTEYSFHLIAINRCGESEPLVACLQTSPVNKNVNQDVYFPPTESSKEKTIDEHSKMFWFYMFLVCVVFILFVILPRFLLSADPVCEKICFGKAWCQAPCWNYVVGTEVFRRDVAKVIMRLLPRSLLHYFVPQVKEEVIFKPDKWWLEWLDFEL